ncbi:MAG: hypothetical protein WBB73_09510 [Candidatus Aminicenantaceae bacterium]
MPRGHPGNGFSQFNLHGPDLTYISRYNGSADEDLRNYISEQSLTFNTMTDLCLLDESRRIYARFEPYQVDIVNVSSGRLVVQAEFSCIPDVIKNGRAYRLNKRVDAFPKVECFLIDPAVYSSGRDPL